MEGEAEVTTENEEFEFRLRAEKEAATKPTAAPVDHSTALLPQVAAETENPNLVAVGKSMMAIPEAISEFAGKAGGKKALSPTEMQGRAAAGKALGEEAPLSRIVGAGTDVALGGVLPAAKAAQGAGALGKIAAGAGTGATYGGLQPTAGTGDFATEKAKQATGGAAIGAALTGIIDKIPGVKPWIEKLFAKSPTAPVAARGEGAGQVASNSQDVSEAIKTKVDRITSGAESRSSHVTSEAERTAARRQQGVHDIGQTRVAAEQSKVDAARSAPSGEPTATAGEFGQTARGVIGGRKTDIEDSIKKATEPARLSAYQEKMDMTPVQEAVKKAKASVSDPSAMKEIERLLQTTIKNTGGERAVVQTKLGPMEVKNGKLVPATTSNSANMDIVHDARQRMLDLIDKYPNDRKAIMQVVNTLDGKAPQSFRDYLALERTERQKLDPFSSTSGPGARTAGVLQRDQYGRDFMSNPESIGGKFLRPGDQGAAGVREFKTATGEVPEAMKSMGAYINGKLKDVEPSKWGSFLKNHEAALKELGVLDKLRKFEQDAIKAQSGLDAAKESQKLMDKYVGEESKRNIKTANDLADSIIAKAAQTARNVGGVVKDSAFGRLVGSDGRALQGQDAQRAIEGIFGGATSTKDLRQLVSMNRENPQGLRDAFKQYIMPTDQTGKVNVSTAAQRWNKTKDSVRDSGLFVPEHYSAIDKVMTDLAKRSEATSSAKAAAGAVGSLLSYKGAVGARTAMGWLTRSGDKSPEQIEGLIQKVMTDPYAAKLAGATPTPKNMEAFKLYMSGGEEVGNLGTIVGSRKAAEDKPRSRFGMLPPGVPAPRSIGVQ